MKRGMFTFMVLFAGLIFITGCTTVNKSMREPNSKVEFTKSDFTFSEQVSATATSTHILNIDWQRLFNQETGTIESSTFPISIAMIPVVGDVLMDKTANHALYELMKANPGYDVVFYPQYLTKVEKPVLGIGFIYRNTTVTATARLAKIK